MALVLDIRRQKYTEYFEYYEGEMDRLFSLPKSLVNGLFLLNITDIQTRFNFFRAASDFYGSAVLDQSPDELGPFYPLFERLVHHWSVTGEYCVVVENNVVNTIRPDYVFPLYNRYNRDIIDQFFFIFPLNVRDITHFQEFSTLQEADVVRYEVATGLSFRSRRTLAGNSLSDGEPETPANVQRVFWEDTRQGFYRSIEGLVRELNIRMAIFQLALNSTSVPILEVQSEGVSGGLLGTETITPAKVAGLGKSGLGLTIPPPFTGQNGARYVERQGNGLEESMGYIRMLLGSLSVMSGVPEYVFGTNLSDSTANVERVMFMGQSRVNRMFRSVENVFGELGVPITFTNEGNANAGTGGV